MNSCGLFSNIYFSPLPPLVFEFSIPKLTLFLSQPSGLNEIAPMLNPSEGQKLISRSPAASRREKCLLLRSYWNRLPLSGMENVAWVSLLDTQRNLPKIGANTERTEPRTRERENKLRPGHIS